MGSSGSKAAAVNMAVMEPDRSLERETVNAFAGAGKRPGGGGVRLRHSGSVDETALLKIPKELAFKKRFRLPDAGILAQKKWELAQHAALVNQTQLEAALEHLAKFYPSGYAVHPQWADMERIVWRKAQVDSGWESWKDKEGREHVGLSVLLQQVKEELNAGVEHKRQPLLTDTPVSQSSPGVGNGHGHGHTQADSAPTVLPNQPVPEKEEDDEEQEHKDQDTHAQKAENAESASFSQLVTALVFGTCASGALELLDHLWDAYADHIDMRARNQRGETPVLVAADWGQWVTVEFLLRVCGLGKTPVEHSDALASDHKEDVSADLEVRNNRDQGLMQLAVLNDVRQVVMLVCEGVELSLSMYHRAFDDALDQNAYNTAGFLYAYNHNKITAGTFVKRLFQLGAVREVQHSHVFRSLAFFEHCKRGLSFNKLPLSGALIMASVFNKLALQMPTQRETLIGMANSFTTAAQEVWGGIDSDVQAALVLEQRPPKGTSVHGSPLDIALRSSNLMFIVNERVVRIAEGWYRPSRFDYKGVAGAGLVSDADHIMEAEKNWQSFKNEWLKLAHPSSMFRMPIVKFWIYALSHVTFLVLISTYALSHPKAHGDVTTQEMVLGVYGVAYVLAELQQWVDQGTRVYWQEGWNTFDWCMCLGIVIVMAIRLPDYPQGNRASELIFLTTAILMILAVWIRSLFLFTGIPRLGPLIVTLRKMIWDIVNFGVLQAVFIISFFFSFDLLAEGNWNNYGADHPFTTARDAILNLFQGGMAADTLTDFETLGTNQGETQRVLAEILGTFYQLITGVVLVNLLIAMMGGTFEAVQDTADAEFVAIQVQAYVRLDRMANDLPPPFNLLVLLLFVPAWIVRRLWLLKNGIGQEPKGTGVCRYCQAEWRDGVAVITQSTLTTNVTQRFNELRAFNFKRVRTPEEPRHAKFRSLCNKGAVCTCARLRSIIHGDRVLMEKIGVFVFALVIFVPALLLSLVLLLYSAMVHQCDKYRDSRDDASEDEPEDGTGDKKPAPLEVEDELDMQLLLPDIRLHDEDDKLDQLLAMQKQMLLADPQVLATQSSANVPALSLGLAVAPSGEHISLQPFYRTESAEDYRTLLSQTPRDR